MEPDFEVIVLIYQGDDVRPTGIQVVQVDGVATMKYRPHYQPHPLDSEIANRLHAMLTTLVDLAGAAS